MAIQSNESELVKRAQAGDHSAFAQLYERYSPAIYRYIYFRVGEAELARDLHSDVFLRMFEGLHRYEDRGWPLSAWLYRIAHDRTVDTLRRHHNQRHISIDLWEGSCDGPEQTIGALLEHEELVRTLSSLTNEQRQVILLRFVKGMSIQEVARTLGRSEGAVKALQYRGLQSLARQLTRAAVLTERAA